MIGYSLSSFDGQLSHVAEEFNGAPVNSFDLEAALGPKLIAYYRGWRGQEATVKEIARWASAEHMCAKLSFDQLCKAKYSDTVTYDDSVEKLFSGDDLNCLLVRKVMSSMWRWGMGDRVWNEVVDGFNGIRDFDLGLPGFEVTLDMTTGHNERGYSRESRTFLDGVFGFLIHYKGEHVMTLGFSVTGGHKLLLQQVQLKNRKGNRFLFKMPVNRLEWILERFARAFPQHTICLVDGAAIAKANIKSYESGIEREQALLDRAETRMRSLGMDLPDYESKDIARYKEGIAELTAKRDFLKKDLPRLKAMYAETGRFKRGEKVEVNKLVHYALAA